MLREYIYNLTLAKHISPLPLKNVAKNLSTYHERVSCILKETFNKVYHHCFIKREDSRIPACIMQYLNAKKLGNKRVLEEYLMKKNAYWNCNDLYARFRNDTEKVNT